MKIIRPLIRLVCISALLTATLSATCGKVFANDIPGYPDEVALGDPRELALVPQYCRHTQILRERVAGDHRMEIERWTATMGPIFEAMHHYCFALMKTNRAMLLARSQQLKTFYLMSSITEIDYVLERAPPDFILLPEILTKKGENLIRLGKDELGIIEIEHAIELKQDYWPPYAALSDYYKKKGDTAKAREWLQKALDFAPDAKALQLRLTELEKNKAKVK
jgi:tetratricopeptide (TPR) repeat protein